MENLNMVYPDSESIYYLSEENSTIIAQGLDSLLKADMVVPAEEEVAVDNSWWQSLATMFEDHFLND